MDIIGRDDNGYFNTEKDKVFTGIRERIHEIAEMKNSKRSKPTKNSKYINPYQPKNSRTPKLIYKDNNALSSKTQQFNKSE